MKSNWVRLLALAVLLYAFLVSVGLMGDAFKTMGRSSAEGLFSGLNNPFAGLAVGILATALLQSSSTTTTLIVTAVGAGQFPLHIAVFAIMGCNIGTTVTNTIVSLGHVRQDAEFKRAFAGATMHDFFNLIAVTIFLPLEWATGVLRTSALWLTGLFSDGIVEEKPSNPVKIAIGWVKSPVKDLVVKDLGLETMAAGIVLLVLALIALSLTLVFITKTMRAVLAGKLELAMNRVLERSGLLAIFIGFLLTVAVQSSSITTSLMIPLFAAGILRLENGFPVTLGANIGTTVTALIASTAGSSEGLTIALVHVLFNVSATVLIYPIPPLRAFPIRCANALAEQTAKNKLAAVAYVLIAFIAIPLLGTILF